MGNRQAILSRLEADSVVLASSCLDACFSITGRANIEKICTVNIQLTEILRKALLDLYETV